jgi:hypothetical protein
MAVAGTIPIGGRFATISLFCISSVGCSEAPRPDVSQAPDVLSPETMVPGSHDPGDAAAPSSMDVNHDVLDATVSDVLDALGPDALGPDAIGPDAIGPDATGPDATGPDATGPDATGPDADEDADTGVPPPEVGKTTEDVLRARGPGCLPCALDAGALDLNGAGTNCERFDSGSAVEICLDTLQCVLNSGCPGPGDSVISCLCGTLDPYTACMDAPPPLGGACVADYYAGFGTKNVGQMVPVFEDPTTPPGSANYLVDLLGATFFSCTDCTRPMSNEGGGSDGGPP